MKARVNTPNEVTIEGWVARDKEGSITIFDKKPERIADCSWVYFPGYALGLSLPEESFPFVTWESEPKKVKLTITPIEDGTDS